MDGEEKAGGEGVGARKKKVSHQKNLISHSDTHENEEGGLGVMDVGVPLHVCVCV